MATRPLRSEKHLPIRGKHCPSLTNQRPILLISYNILRLRITIRTIEAGYRSQFCPKRLIKNRKEEIYILLRNAFMFYVML